VTLQLGAGAGIALPTSDYGGTMSDFYSGTKYGLHKGLNLHAKARVGLIGLQLVGEANYSTFSNSGAAQQGGGSIDLKQKVTTFKLGPEFYLGIPFAPISPYLGLDVSFNRFTGDVKFQGVSKVASGTYDLNAASRVGFGFNGGVVFNLGSFTGLDISAAYDFLNSSGKTWDVSNAAQAVRLDSYRSLNDDKDPLYRAGDDKHFVNNSRTITAVTIRATIMIGL
jgi:hypothetical protein